MQRGQGLKTVAIAITVTGGTAPFPIALTSAAFPFSVSFSTPRGVGIVSSVVVRIAAVADVVGIVDNNGSIVEAASSPPSSSFSAMLLSCSLFSVSVPLFSSLERAPSSFGAALLASSQRLIIRTAVTSFPLCCSPFTTSAAISLCGC